MYTFIKENYDIKELGKSFTYLKNEQMTYIRNFETSTAKSSMNENPLFNSSHREHIKLPLGIMCCFKTAMKTKIASYVTQEMYMYFI